jgi:hypothetical protein
MLYIRGIPLLHVLFNYSAGTPLCLSLLLRQVGPEDHVDLLKLLDLLVRQVLLGLGQDGA